MARNIIAGRSRPRRRPTSRPTKSTRWASSSSAELHGRMDPILKSLGYTQGTVGERMQALAKDPRYKFSEGDKGRAEIMAYIQERIALIRAVLPRAFNTLGPRQSRSEAHVARGRSLERRRPMAARARSTARSRASSGSICEPPICTASTTCPTLPRTRPSRATSGRANMPTSCR